LGKSQALRQIVLLLGSPGSHVPRSTTAGEFDAVMASVNGIVEAEITIKSKTGKGIKGTIPDGDDDLTISFMNYEINKTVSSY